VPRDLADVLHYFMPELTPDAAGTPASVLRPTSAEVDASRTHRVSEARPNALPIVAVPISDQQIVCASLVSGIADHIASLGGDATILTPSTPNSKRLFLRSSVPSQGARVQTSRADSLSSLFSAAVELSETRADDADGGGVVLVRVPPAWLRGAEDASELLDWVLLFSATDSRSLADTYALAAWVLGENPGGEIGVTIYGASDQREAEEAFGALAQSVEQRLGLSVASYGLIIEDLDVYRAILTGRALGQANPQSLAAGGVREAAKLVFERARKAEVS
jgi:hypothetical protein